MITVRCPSAKCRMFANDLSELMGTCISLDSEDHCEGMEATVTEILREMEFNTYR